MSNVWLRPSSNDTFPLKKGPGAEKLFFSYKQDNPGSLVFVLSSTQYSSNNAWYYNWNNEYFNNNNKNNNNGVRPVCEFFTECKGILLFNFNIKMVNEHFEYLISLEDVFDAYYDCRKNKRKTFNAIDFEIDFETKLVQLWHDINTGNYVIGKSICFLVTKPKLREVFAADFRDRIVHHIACRKLEPLFEKSFIDDSYNCRKGKGTSYGVKRLHQQIKEISEDYTKDCYIGKFDLQGFFMSINRNILWNILNKFISENYNHQDKPIILKLVHQIVTHKPERNCIIKGNPDNWKKLDKNKSLFTCGDDYGLPIGNLTSQMFANFYLHELDYKLSNYFNGYGRYVDDFYIIDVDKQKIIDSIQYISKYLKTYREVTLHPHKQYIQHYSKGCKFIGSMVKMNRMYVGNYTVGRFYTKIKYFNTMMEKDNNWLDDIDNKKSFLSSINCYLGFARQYNSYKIKYKILSSINPIWYKYAYPDINCNKICLA